MRIDQNRAQRIRPLPKQLKVFIENEQLLYTNRVQSEAQFDDIAERFADIQVYADDPVRLPEALTVQKRNIAALIATKDRSIEKLRSDYLRLDEDYDRHMAKHRTDMHYLYLRMHEHIEAMRSSFTNYLQVLQETVDSERETLNLTVCRKWSDLHDRINDNLVMKHRVEQEKRAFYDEQLDRIRLEHAETTRAARIQLQSDEQSVHLELQQLRASAALNGAKFDYNLQILMKKADENVTVRNQQKRKLAQMRESVHTLRQQIADIRSNLVQSSAKCTDVVQRFHSRFMDLEIRADRYAGSSEKIFNDVWQMNEEESGAMLKRVLAIDKVLFEQQLGLPWTQPSRTPLDKTELDSFRKAMQTLYGCEKDTATLKSDQSISSEPSTKSLIIPDSKSTYAEQMLANTRVLRKILRQIGEETDFLVEKKLMDLLRPYLNPIQMDIVQVDHIFQALGIQSMRDISTLITHFVPYAWCLVCTPTESDVLPTEESNNSSDTSMSVSRQASRNTIAELKASFRRKTMMSMAKVKAHSVVIRDSRATEFMDDDLAAIIQDIDRNDQAAQATPNKMSFFVDALSFDECLEPPPTPCERHTLVIETGCVLAVFRSYARACLNANRKTAVGGIGGRTEATTMAARLACVRSTVPRLLSADDVELFWRRYREVFTEERRQLWESLEHGLQEYLRVLRRREQLDEECEQMRQQNAELRHLLQPYLHGNNG